MTTMQHPTITNRNNNSTSWPNRSENEENITSSSARRRVPRAEQPIYIYNIRKLRPVIIIHPANPTKAKCV